MATIVLAGLLLLTGRVVGWTIMIVVCVFIAAALLGVPLRTYIIGTVFGIIPATFAFASIGAGLDSVIAAAKSEQLACIASKAAASCPFGLSAKSLVTKEILIALTLLGIVALIPVAYKKWSQRHG